MKIKETFIVFGTVTLALMFTRFVITRFVSHNWLVSFAIMASISVTLLVLAKKEKMGPWGKMFLRQMIKNQHGRRAVFFYGTSVFLIAVIVFTIYTINVGNDMRLAGVKQDLVAQVPELEDKNMMIKEIKNTPPLELAEQMLLGLVSIPGVLIYEFPTFAVMVSILDDQFHGLISSLYLVSLVEYLEVVGIMLFYRIALRKTKIPDHSQIS